MIEEIEELGPELKPGPLPEGRSLEHGGVEVVDAITAKACIDALQFQIPNRGCGEAADVKPSIQSAVQLNRREMATASNSRQLPKTQTSARTG